MPSKSINQDCIGSNFDDFLKEEGILEEVEAKAKETVATYVNKRNNYEDSFKKEMVERYNNGESAKSLREKYGFSQKSLCYWTKLFQYATAEEFVENGEDPYSDVEQEEADNLALSIIEEFSKPMEPIKINQEVFMRLYDKHSTIDLNDLNNLQVTKTVEASRSFGKVSGGCVYYVILDEKREELIRNADLEGVQAYFTVLTRITHKDKPIKLTLESVVVTETREVIRELNPGV
jgi:transposase-like protein